MSIKTALFIVFGLTIVGIALLGTLAVYQAPLDAKKEVQQVTVIIVISLSIILPATLWFIIKTLLDPLREMIHVLHRIGASEFETRAAQSEILEIQILAQALNTVSTQLQWTHRKLKEKAEQKEKEAADKMKEYEQLSRFMAGRESKMIELKQEITELKRKLDVNPGALPKQNS